MERILTGLYKRDFERVKITTASLGFEGRDAIKEAAYYLNALETLGYIEIDHNAFQMGGRTHEEFNNNVAMIWWENIHLTKDGLKYLKENNLI